MTKQYQLIHIDTNEVTMCEKITIEGKDYYCNKDIPKKYYIEDTSTIREPVTDDIHYWGSRFSYNNIIATTNTSLQCPQVIDEVFLEWDNSLKSQLKSMDKSLLYDYPTGRNAFFWGYKSHSETHSLSDEEVVQFVSNVDFKGGILNPKELLEIFKSTLPTKVYYR